MEKSVDGKDKVVEIVPRITQLDSVELDTAIRDILSNQLLDISKYVRPGLLNGIKPELELIVDLLVFSNSILKNGSTFGQDLMNLKYNRQLNGTEACIYAFYSVILPYAKRRIDESSSGESRYVQRIMDVLHNLGRISNLANFLLFLDNGIYPTIVDRFLGIKHQLVKKLNRNINYNFMMRELLWHSLMELVTFTLPLINIQAVKRNFRSLFSKPVPREYCSPPTMTIHTVCSICSCRPNLPCRISLHCSHVACYVCLKGNIMADNKFTCPECGAANNSDNHIQYIRCSLIG